jgi:hypothetical protein
MAARRSMIVRCRGGELALDADLVAGVLGTRAYSCDIQFWQGHPGHRPPVT